MHNSEKYRYLTLSVLLFVAIFPALISCSSSDVPGNEDEKPLDNPSELTISFRGPDVYSRSVDLETLYDSFCVRSFKVGEDDSKWIVMPDYIVKYIDGEWVYDELTSADGSTQYLRYWDLSAKSYTFAAVTPTTPDSAFSLDDSGNISITVPDMSTDWMIARTIRRGVNDATKLLDFDDIVEKIEEIDKSTGKTSDVFPTPNSPLDKVPLNFHRIFAKVIIKVYAESEITLSPLEVGFTNIGVTPATYNTASGWASTPLGYQELYNKNTLITDEQNTRETAQLLTELFVIPQQQTDASNNSLVQIKVQTDNDDDRAYNLNLPGLWEPNKVYIYYLKFEDEATGEVILFDVEVEPFTKGSEAENEQTNW